MKNQQRTFKQKSDVDLDFNGYWWKMSEVQSKVEKRKSLGMVWDGLGYSYCGSRWMPPTSALEPQQ